MRLGTNTEILLDRIYKELLKISEAIVPAPQEAVEAVEEVKVEIAAEDIQPEQPKKAAPKKKK